MTLQLEEFWKISPTIKSRGFPKNTHLKNACFVFLSIHINNYQPPENKNEKYPQRSNYHVIGNHISDWIVCDIERAKFINNILGNICIQIRPR